MNAMPSNAPAMQAAVIIQKSAPVIESVYPSRKSTGTVKITPEFEVLTAEAIVWAMLVSRIDPLRRMPRSTPKPSTAAIADPPIVKPILRPA